VLYVKFKVINSVDAVLYLGCVYVNIFWVTTPPAPPRAVVNATVPGVSVPLVDNKVSTEPDREDVPVR
jgi:hypothetical protein